MSVSLASRISVIAMAFAAVLMTWYPTLELPPLALTTAGGTVLS